MVQNDFINLMRDMSTYFERKAPTQDTLRLWYEDCQNIPSECLPELRKEFRYLEAMPKNLPRYLWALFKEWLERHPEKRVIEVVGCSQCHEGSITVSRYSETNYFPGWVDLVFRCSVCNGKKGGVPVKSQLELLRLGYFAPAYGIRQDCHKAFPLPLSLLSWDHPVRMARKTFLDEKSMVKALMEHVTP